MAVTSLLWGRTLNQFWATQLNTERERKLGEGPDSRRAHKARRRSRYFLGQSGLQMQFATFGVRVTVSTCFLQFYIRRIIISLGRSSLRYIVLKSSTH